MKRSIILILISCAAFLVTQIAQAKPEKFRTEQSYSIASDNHIITADYTFVNLVAEENSCEPYRVLISRGSKVYDLTYNYRRIPVIRDGDNLGNDRSWRLKQRKHSQ